MLIEITKSQEELKREHWRFQFIADWSRYDIRLEYYATEYKDNPRQRLWRTDKHWETMDSRRNNMDNPPTPDDIIAQVKQEIINAIKELNHIIVRGK